RSHRRPSMSQKIPKCPVFSDALRTPHPPKRPIPRHRAPCASVQNEPTCASKAGEVSRMKESHDQGPANPIDPESCAAAREGVGEALTGADAGRPYSPESVSSSGRRRACGCAEGHTSTGSPWREPVGSGGAAEPAHASKHLAK